MSIKPEAGQPEVNTPQESSLPGNLSAENTPPSETIPSEKLSPAESTPEAEALELSSEEVPIPLFRTVLDDLLSRTGGKKTDIEVIKAEAVTWPDGSIGCPQPDVMYTQALVNGYQVILGLNGEEFDYHLSDSGYFVLCENVFPGRPIIEPPTQ